MPLPTPTEGETEQEFVSRCMGDETIQADFDSQEQRSAVCYRQWEDAHKAAADPNVGGGRVRENLENSDFVFSDERKFPVVTPGDVSDAVSSWGRYKGSHSFEQFKSRLIALCRRKGASFVRALPKEWDVKAVDNALRAIKRTEDELTVGNYIILYGGRDLEGVGSANVNPDGTRGEYFTPATVLDSAYTKAGAFYVDWEHAQGEAGDDLLGVVNWKTARVDDKGVFVERVLSRRNRYVQWLEELGWFDDGTLGTSSQADPDGVEKAADGQIVRWPLMRDTITVQPMEPRMLAENQLRAYKALGLVPDDKQGGAEEAPEPEQETAPEADPSAVAVARARARLQFQLLSLEEQ